PGRPAAPAGRRRQPAAGTAGRRRRIEAFCQAIRTGLATATFEQRRLLAELLIDRVIVTDDQVEIRYVLPTSPEGPHRPFCQLCKDHLVPPADPDRLAPLGLDRWPRNQALVCPHPRLGQVAVEPVRRRANAHGQLTAAL